MNNELHKEIFGTVPVVSDMRRHFNNLEKKRQEKLKKRFNTSYKLIMENYLENKNE
jgi:hypothetical protein